MPYTMEGMAANNSMAVPNGRLSHAGDSSVRNKAMPKLTGTAINSGDQRSRQGAVDHDQATETPLAPGPKLVLVRNDKSVLAESPARR